MGARPDGLIPAPTPTARARRLARAVHAGQPDRYGNAMIDHVERVAEIVPASARAVAFVHDVPERSDHDPVNVALLVGLDDDELGALVLLTKRGGETLREHIRRITDSENGVSRELAIVIKRADLDDHDRSAAVDDQAYGDARKLLATA